MGNQHFHNLSLLDRVLFAIAWSLALLAVAAVLFLIPHLEARVTALEAQVNARETKP